MRPIVRPLGPSAGGPPALTAVQRTIADSIHGGEPFLAATGPAPQPVARPTLDGTGPTLHANDLPLARLAAHSAGDTVPLPLGPPEPRHAEQGHPAVTPGVRPSAPTPPMLTTIQRVTDSTPAAPALAELSASSAPSSSGAEGGQIDEDELAERVLRKVVRRLAVEAERRGARRWP
jgi:hypothetical protein